MQTLDQGEFLKQILASTDTLHSGGNAQDQYLISTWDLK